MKYIEYKEHRTHGTKDFPFAYYSITEQHPRYLMQCHWHKEYEIIHIFEGTFHLTVNNMEYTLQKGDSALLESGALHSGFPEACHYACIVFDLDDFLTHQPWATDLYQKLSCYDLHFLSFLPSDMTSARALQSCIISLCNALAEKPDGYRFAAIGFLCQFLGLLIQNKLYAEHAGLSNIQQKKISQLKQVLSYISQHYQEDISLSDMAACVNMNKNYFCKAFRETTHKTPMEYLNYYRIESACEQLATSDKSILSIALDCGFHDVSYFVKVFKKYKGTVPSKYLFQN